MSRDWTQEEIDADMDGYGQNGPPCPRCDGHRVVDCHCGGDLCVCDNYGEKDCPLCYGEGVASPERAEKYLEGRREMAEIMRKMWAEDAAKGKVDEPPTAEESTVDRGKGKHDDHLRR